ncbi:hypothetical protein T12_9748 [Trichinella patagoniensis]|uniref:Uncharacterized protein n=1 Tax=Trichinella patagoniensis TaxID=990121 RepID=A0A0V0YXU8_9BILA|nr:hypothetical protein T12_9748 [Trichinella patagoniensis]
MTFYVSSSSTCPQQFFIADSLLVVLHSQQQAKGLEQIREEDDKGKKGAGIHSFLPLLLRKDSLNY